MLAAVKHAGTNQRIGDKLFEPVRVNDYNHLNYNTQYSRACIDCISISDRSLLLLGKFNF